MLSKEEQELRRLLHTGGSGAGVNLPIKHSDREIPDILAAVQSLAGTGRVNLPLQHCLAAREGGLADPRALLLALSACLKLDCKATRTAVYSSLPPLIQSAEDLFEFIFCHRKVFRKRPHGMGAGMRRLLSSWYLSQDPFDLALEVLRVSGRHRWSHADLIKLARVRSSDPARAAVLMALVRSPDAARKEFGSRPESQPILEYLTTVQTLKRETDPLVAVGLVEKHSFDVDMLPSHLLQHPAVWEAALPRLPLRRLLSHLKALWRRGLLGPESQVMERVVSCLSSPLALSASGLQPGEILTCLALLETSWAPLPGQAPNPSLASLPPPHPALAAALSSLLESSLGNVPRAPGCVLVALDCRPCLSSNHCWGAPGVSCARAAATTVLALRAGGATVQLVTRCPGRMVALALGEEETVGGLAARLARVQGAQVVQPLQVVTWAKEEGVKADLVLCLTDSHTEVEDREEVWTALEEYRAAVPGSKFVYSVLGSRNMARAVAREGDHLMLDMCGWWGMEHLRILQAFLTDRF